MMTSELPVAPTGSRIRDKIDHFARNYPARLALIVFALIILIISSLLCLPIATTDAPPAHIVEALFTATSAVCVTGHSIVDTATYWSPFGQTAIAVGIQIGGLGVMTLASLIGLAISRHIGLTQRILAANETGSRLGEVGGLLKVVIITSMSAETLIALALLPSFMDREGSFLKGLFHAVFTSISSFNNAGFIIEPNLGFAVGNWAICVPIMMGTICGGLGFPVMLNIAQNPRSPRRWTIHTKLTVTTYALVWITAVVMIGAQEWNGAFRDLTLNQHILATLFHATTVRSTGISSVDIASMSQGTWLTMDALMFIGSGSASTGGGIKVSTFAVLVLAILAEARGDRDTEVFGKRLPPDVIRLAISAAFLGAFVVGVASLAILQISGEPLGQVLFDTVSAFATCGLSTGLAQNLPTAGKLVLIVVMYLGRVGTMTFAGALALRSRRRVIRLPEDRPIIG
ncbi:TrkH family potassium uptake protein [Trueperella sp. LYQ143]|uniref:TrkH family potassium uptake protein n=1 Tax=unclassified Trueperella TaxID=2630174 RepID=UPI003983470B